MTKNVNSNKRLSILLLTLVFIGSLSLLISSCGGEDDEPKPTELTSITINNTSVRTEYYVGENLDLSGLVVTFNMDDGSSEDIVLSDFISNGLTCSPVNGTELTSSNTTVIITHTKSGKSINLTIIVNTVEVSEISLKDAPLKIEYYAGETLNLEGLVITCTLNNGETKDVEFVDFVNNGITCSPNNGTELSEQTEVIITHTNSGESISQSLTVHEIEVTEVSIKTAPTKINYYEGEVLDLLGIVVTLTKNNGETEDVELVDFVNKNITCSPNNGTELTEQTEVIITHTTSGKSEGQVVNYMKVFDNDENVYQVVKIGEQFWMAENLKATKYNDGAVITLINDNTVWSNLTTAAYCWYNNDEETHKNTYGALYNWYAVSTGALCPIGWHMPNDTEWTTLTDYLGGVSVAGGKLRETGTLHWKTPNTGATNESGFTALPGGIRALSGVFAYVEIAGYWWSDTEYSTGSAWSRDLIYSNVSINREDSSKKNGFSVRCVKD